jgi:SAM-dependent methyltransferase
VKRYLNQQVDTEDCELLSVIDDIPLWSAPFGLALLNTIKLAKGVSVLDFGCGLGFPLIEIAERLGESSKVYGIDPWGQALDGSCPAFVGI